VKSLLTKWDHNDKDEKLSLEEWMAMLRKDPDVLTMLFKLGFINKADATIGETDYDDMDSDIEAETERRTMERSETDEKIKNGIEHNEKTEADHTHGLEKEVVSMPWKNKVKDKLPSAWKSTPDSSCPPNASLELEYVYGIRCHDVRNNLRYGDGGQLIYHTGGAGVVMDAEKMTQRHFLEHSDDITCLDVYNNLVLTGQHGLVPMLMVWDLNTLNLIAVWKDQLSNGIANCCFSTSGRYVAAIAMDDDHSIAVYDINKGIEYRKDPRNSDFGLIALGKVTKKDVFDIKFD
jgi:WD40 repeat protein